MCFKSCFKILRNILCIANQPKKDHKMIYRLDQTKRNHFENERNYKQERFQECWHITEVELFGFLENQKEHSIQYIYFYKDYVTM